MKKDKFLEIIDATPLVSIDLVVEDSQDRVLLGKRLNRPAQDYWFVPGGRIRKNETLADAMRRISSAELGTALDIDQANLLGAYDHIYHDNFHGIEGINTHYVVLGYRLAVSDDFQVETDDQHSEIDWWDKDKLLTSEEVHGNTKAYFINCGH